MPIEYLGYTLYKGRKKIQYFGDIIAKTEKKLAGWKTRLLSHGSRIVLIKHVLQSIPIYILVAVDLPKVVLHIIDQICSNFLWGEGRFGLKHQWIRWDQFCLPTVEGAISVRSMQDVNKAFGMKL